MVYWMFQIHSVNMRRVVDNLSCPSHQQEDVHVTSLDLVARSPYIQILFYFERKLHLSVLLEKCTYRKHKRHFISRLLYKLIPTSDQTHDII